MMLAQGASCARRSGRALAWKSGASAPRQSVAGEWALALVSDVDTTSEYDRRRLKPFQIRSLNAALKGRSSTGAHTADPKTQARKPKAESRKPKAESRKPKAESRKPKA